MSLLNPDGKEAVDLTSNGYTPDDENDYLSIFRSVDWNLSILKSIKFNLN